MNSDALNRKTRLSLLHNTQAFLKALLEEEVPDSGLVQAWQEFYRVYDGLIRRFVIARGVSGADVDDCVQEVWMEVVVRLTGFNRPPNRPGLRSWLYTLVRAKASNLFRRKSRWSTESLERAKRAGREPSEPSADPAASLEKEWQHALLETVLDEFQQEVSEINHQVLRMRWIDNRSVNDVASSLSLTPEQVRSRSHRTMKKLRDYLAHFTGEPMDA